MKTGYIQSTSKLEIEEQSELLISNGCTKIYVETSKDLHYKDKQKLQSAIDSLSSGDILAVTRLSILCISVQSLLEVLFELEDKNVTLEVVQQQFISKDTHTLDELQGDDLNKRIITKKSTNSAINSDVFIKQVNSKIKEILGDGYTSHSFRQGLITLVYEIASSAVSHFFSYLYNKEL